MSSFIALDLEFNQPSQRIIQVGVAVGALGQPESEWDVRQWLLNPGEPVDERIVALTGIDDAAIAAHAVAWQTMAEELGGLLQERTPFLNPVTWGGGDSALLLGALHEQGVAFPHFGRRWVDVKTLYMYVELARRGRPPKGGLSSALVRHGLKFQGEPHRADCDAFNTLRLFFRLLERQAALEGLVQAARTLDGGGR